MSGKIWLMCWLMGCSLFASAQPATSGGRLSVLTCSPGDMIYSCFGHSAIRYQGLINEQPVDVVYNYGMFDSFEENFELKFMSGSLLYELGKEDFRRFKAAYAYEGRSVIEQDLDLSNEDIQRIVAFLENNYLPENRKYHYHFFFDNCSSRVRDVLQQVLGERISIPVRDMEGQTFRNMIDPYLEPFPWTDFGIDLVLGMPTDKKVGPLEEAFLPDFLMEQMNTATLDGRSLVGAQRTVIPEQRPPLASGVGPTLVLWLLCLLLAGGLVLMRIRGWKSGWLRSTVWAIIGLLGLVMLVMWTATNHDTTINNLNILFASPLLLLMLFSKPGSSYQRLLLLLTLIPLIVYWLAWSVLPQQFHPATLPLALLVVVSLVTSASFQKVWRDNRDRVRM